MIGLGAKYLTAAGFGRYRITAASLGNLDLLGTFRWLKYATLQAILGAFGDDGVAVIKATNAYLDGIAASDRDKATALAGFINEDPMMVCSLGLQVPGVTVPYRQLVGDGTAYVNTGVMGDTPRLCFECIATPMGMTGYARTLFGEEYNNNTGWHAYGIIYHNIAGIGLRVGTIGAADIASGISNGTENVKFEGIVTDTTFEFIVNGVSKGTKTKGTPYARPIFLYGLNVGGLDGTSPTPSKFNYIRFYADGDDKGYFLPMKLSKAWAAEDVSTGVAQAAGTCGMIDLVSGKFFPNANSQGSFTIPDISYTPSTP